LTVGINGNGDTSSVASNDTASVSGNIDLFAISTSLGLSTINGFNSTDTMQLSAPAEHLTNLVERLSIAPHSTVA
jgi:hypothetical protein